MIRKPPVIPPTTISRQRIKSRGVPNVDQDDVASFKQWLQTNMISVPENAYLESELFTPTFAYVEQVLEDPDVHDAIEWWKLWSSAFMVTGVKIARDLRAMQSNLNCEVTTSFNSEAPASPTINTRTQLDVRLQIMSDFVFAYRLAEIKFPYFTPDLNRHLTISRRPYEHGHAIAVIDDNYSDTTSGIITDEDYELEYDEELDR
jgi:hypothetical protein